MRQLKNLCLDMKRKMAAALTVTLMITSIPTGTVYADELPYDVVLSAEEELEEINTGNISNVDFSDFQFQTVPDDRKRIDGTFIGDIIVKSGIKEAALIEKNGEQVLEMKALSEKINSNKSNLNMTERFGIECKVMFSDNTSIRKIAGMKGIADGGNYAWLDLLVFENDGKIRDAAKKEVGSYAADTWYTIKIDVNTETREYRAWIGDGNNPEMFTKASLNVGGGGDRIWRGCAQSNLFEQGYSAGSSNSLYVSYVKVGDLKKPEPIEELGGTITGSITDLDFSDYAFKGDTEKEKMVDNTFVGTIGVKSGAKEASITENVLRMSAITEKISSYKGGLKITDRFGIECKVKFSDNTSVRKIAGMKGIADGNNYAWLDLLKFGNDGKITNAAQKILGSYKANRWYTIKIDVNTETQEYRAWIEDGRNSVMFTKSSLNVGGSGDQIWRGCAQSNLFGQELGTGTPNTLEVAYVRVGQIKPDITGISVEDIEMVNGEGKIIYPQVIPADSDVSGLTYSSSDTSVVKTFENAVLAVGAGNATVTVQDTKSGIQGSFQVTVKEDEKNWNLQKSDEKTLNYVLNTSRRDQIDATVEEIKEYMNADKLLEPEVYKDMDDEVIGRLVEEDFKKLVYPINIDKDSYEMLSRYLVLMHKQTGEIEYANKAAIILYHQAKHYPHLLLNKNDKENQSFAGQAHYGENAVYAFGYLLNLDNEDVWNVASGISAEEVKETIAEIYIRPMADGCMDYLMTPGRHLGNIDPYGVRSTAVAATILNDPYLMRKVIRYCDELLNGQYYYMDGMWEESTISYGSQVSSNLSEALHVLAGYTDPADYEDPENFEEYGLTNNVMGITLNGTDLTDRYPMLNRTKQIENDMFYPNGTRIAVSDTHYNKELDVDFPVEAEYLDNIELPGLGYFGLVQGEGKDAVHAGLLNQSFQKKFGAGHDHINTLSLTLWGGGTELLPDVGYVTSGNYPEGGYKDLRFPSMKPVLHNMPYVFWENGNNTKDNLGWMKPRLMAYDDGSANGGIVEMVEASETGNDAAQADINQRLLMNIKLDETSSYVFDLSRMKGGDAHELFQRGSELENMKVQTEGISFTPATEKNGNLLQISPFKEFKENIAIKDMAYLYNPQKSDSSEDFSFTWTGEDSGSSITTYMNGVAGSSVYLSQLPTPRRITNGNQEDAANLTYFAPHITRYSKPGADTVTKYGAVHETLREGQNSRIESVEWGYPEGIDAMGITAKITTDISVDYIYISGDNRERIYDGITFAGKTVLIRKDKETGETIYTYVYGNKEQKAEVVDLTTAPVLPFDGGTENTITVSGVIEDAESYIGKWVQLVFGDESGYGMKVQNVEVEEGNTIITTDGYVPAKLTDTGVELVFHPYGLEIEGDVSVIFTESSEVTGSGITGIQIKELPKKTIYEVGESFDPSGMVVVASSSNAEPVEIPLAECEIDSSHFDSETPGTYEIIVRYIVETDGAAMTYEASFEVVVVENLSELCVDRIEVAELPVKTEYQPDEELDTEGMVVKLYRVATGSNAEPVVDILSEDEYGLEYNFEVSDEVVVSYVGIATSGNEETFTDSFHVQVYDEDDFYTSGIRVTKKPYKMKYYTGDELDLTGMEVTVYLKATASNAEIATGSNVSQGRMTVKKVLDESEYEVECDSDLQEAGYATVTITHTGVNKDGEEEDFTDKFEIEVEDSIDEDNYYTTKIKITKKPKKKKYYLDDDIDLAGMEVIAYLRDFDTDEPENKRLDESEYEVDFDFSRPGKAKVYVIYYAVGEDGEEREFKDYFTVNVKRHGTSDSGSGGYSGNVTGILVAANTWEVDNIGWKLKKADGTYYVDQWVLARYNGREDWYRIGKDGYVLSGWFQDADGNRYYLNEQHDGFFGAMATGWKQLGADWYYFNEVSDGTKGCMLKDKKIGQYYVNIDGIWVK